MFVIKFLFFSYCTIIQYFNSFFQVHEKKGKILKFVLFCLAAKGSVYVVLFVCFVFHLLTKYLVLKKPAMIVYVQCWSFSSAAPADDAGPPGPMSYDDDNNVPAPEKSKVACPQCIVTGVVDILKDICKKQGELLSDLFCAILKHSEETKF